MLAVDDVLYAAPRNVPAQLVRVELEEHDGDDATTYETTATFRYDYAGQAYTGTRVAISTGPDNIGDFQRRLYYELHAAYESGAPVKLYWATYPFTRTPQTFGS